jgi:hypothetical protein
MIREKRSKGKQVKRSKRRRGEKVNRIKGFV